MAAKAEGEREAAVNRAQGNKQSLILAAEGRQEAANRDAEARERLAAAEAAATRMVAEAAANGGEPALRYFIADRYVEAFKLLANSPNSKMIVVPMEASALAGGIAQALTLLKADAPAQAGRAVTTSIPPVGGV